MKEKKDNDSWSEKVTCQSLSLLHFSRNLALMLQAGIPISVALDTLCHVPEDPKFERVLSELAYRVSHGFNLSNAMAGFPRCFPLIYCRMVEIGESTGTLVTSLEALSDWTERERKTREQVRGALVYPAFVLSVTFVLTVLLITFFVPQVLQGTSRPERLPLFSRGLLALSELLGNGGFWLVTLGVVGVTAPSLLRFLKSERGERLAWEVPVLGPLLCYAASSRYSLTLSTLLNHGVDLTRSLRLAAESCGSASVAYDARRMLEGVKDGQSLAELYNVRPDLYPLIFRQMVHVGEESSQLGTLLSRSADLLASETEYLLQALLSALEPLVMTIVAVIVGAILIAVFSSIYAQLGSL